MHAMLRKTGWQAGYPLACFAQNEANRLPAQFAQNEVAQLRFPAHVLRKTRLAGRLPRSFAQKRLQLFPARFSPDRVWALPAQFRSVHSLRESASHTVLSRPRGFVALTCSESGRGSRCSGVREAIRDTSWSSGRLDRLGSSFEREQHPTGHLHRLYARIRNRLPHPETTAAMADRSSKRSSLHFARDLRSTNGCVARNVSANHKELPAKDSGMPGKM